MARMCIPFILTQEYPTATWQVVGEDDNYDGLDWRADDIDKPSLETLKSLWAEKYEARWQLIGVHKTRAAEYPPIGDQLDALLKGFAQLSAQGATLPPDLAAVIDAWQAVKAAHPKPVANA